MNRMIMMVTITLGLSLAGQAQAESNALNGMLLGAGSGALVGQAVGRDTKGTLVGAAVGTMLGYAIGNEMDKGGVGPHYYQPRVVVVRPESRETCREVEMLATIEGRPARVYRTACWQDGGWVRIADERPLPIVYQKVIIHDDHGRHGHHERHWGGFREEGHGDHGRGREVIYRPGW